MDQGGEEQISHKRIGIAGSRDSSEDIFKGPQKQSSSRSDGQHDSPPLLDSQRRNKVQGPDRDIQKDMGVPIPTGDHNYCIMDPVQREQNSGLEIPTESQFERMEAIQPLPSVQKVSMDLGDTRDCFASRVMHKLPLYMSLNPDPNCLATNALHQNWGSYPYLPPFYLIGRVLKSITERQAPKALLIAPS